MLNVSRRTVQHAREVRETGIPALISAVEQGNVAVSTAASLAKQSDDFQRAVTDALAEGLKLSQAVNRAFRGQTHKQLWTPKAMDPPEAGRIMRVARNRDKRQWLLVIGPNAAGSALKDNLDAARHDDEIVAQEQERAKLIERAAELEAEAKALRAEAEDVRKEINEHIRDVVEYRHGPAFPFSESYDFQAANEEVDVELAELPDDDRVDRLLAARGGTDEHLQEIQRGYWGDMTFMSARYQPPVGGPGWTKVGSPEWIDEVFRPQDAMDKS
jgi:hypothetical protein